MTPDNFDAIRARGRWKRKPGCPPEEEWARVAAGLMPSEEAERRIEHAAQCDYCSAVLRTMAEDFQEDWTEEEEKTLGEARSASEEWQRGLARRLSEARGRSTRHGWARWLAIGVAAAVMVALTAGGFLCGGGRGATGAGGWSGWWLERIRRRGCWK